MRELLQSGSVALYGVAYRDGPEPRLSIGIRVLANKDQDPLWSVSVSCRSDGRPQVLRWIRRWDSASLWDIRRCGQVLGHVGQAPSTMVKSSEHPVGSEGAPHLVVSEFTEELFDLEIRASCSFLIPTSAGYASRGQPADHRCATFSDAPTEALPSLAGRWSSFSTRVRQAPLTTRKGVPTTICGSWLHPTRVSWGSLRVMAQQWSTTQT